MFLYDTLGEYNVYTCECTAALQWHLHMERDRRFQYAAGKGRSHATPLTCFFLSYTGCHWQSRPSTLSSICRSNNALYKALPRNDP